MGIEFDPFTTHLGATPYSLYRQLRDQGPIHHSTSSAQTQCVQGDNIS